MIKFGDFKWFLRGISSNIRVYNNKTEEYEDKEIFISEDETLYDDYELEDFIIPESEYMIVYLKKGDN